MAGVAGLNNDHHPPHYGAGVPHGDSLHPKEVFIEIPNKEYARPNSGLLSVENKKRISNRQASKYCCIVGAPPHDVKYVYAQKSQESLQVVPKLSQNCLRVVSKLSQSCLKVVSKFPRSFLKAVLKLFQSSPKVVDIWAWRMGSMWDGIKI